MPSLLFVHALSPLHAGTGHAVGAVDLPIARDKATGFPYVPGSSIKGVLRDAARSREWSSPQVEEVFGPERDRASDHAGALLVGDASLLLLPARSVVGTFAWVTSPWLLRRLARDAKEAGLAPPAISEPKSIDVAHVTADAKIKHGDKVFFEDLDFTAAADDKLGKLAEWLGERIFKGTKTDQDNAPWKQLLKEKLCVVHDDAMAFFAEHGTDVVTRIALDPEVKTVKQGALWTEESLPTESILVSLVAGQSNGKLAADAAVAKVHSLLDRSLRLGGHASVGRGRCRLTLDGGTQ